MKIKLNPFIARAGYLILFVYCFIVFDAHFHGADEPIYYQYTASIVDDGDLNIANQMFNPGEKYYVSGTFDIPFIQSEGGVIFWTPFYAAAKALSRSVATIIGRGAYPFDLKAAASAALSLSTVLFGLFALAGIYTLCISFSYSRAASAGAAAAIFLGTPFFYYMLFEPGNANVLSMLLAVVLIAAVIVRERMSRSDFFVFGLYYAACVIVKVDLCLYMLLLVPAIAASVLKRRLSWGHCIMFLVGFVLLYGMKLYNQYLRFGSLIPDEFMYVLGFGKSQVAHFSHGLFGAYRGVFFTSPVILLCFIGGIVVSVRTRDWFLVGLAAIAACKLWLLNHLFIPADGTLASRLLLTEMPIFALLCARAFSFLRGKWILAGVCGFALAAAWNMLAVARHMSHMDWVFLSVAPDPSTLAYDAGNILFCLLYPKDIGVKSLVAVPAAITALLSFYFFHRNRNILRPQQCADKENFVQRWGIPIMRGTGIYAAVMYSGITLMNGSTHAANVSRLRQTGFYENAIVLEAAQGFYNEDDAQHVLFDMMRYYAGKGETKALSELKKQNQGVYDNTRFPPKFLLPAKGYADLLDYYVSNKRTGRAIATYERMIALYPFDVEAYVGLGDLLSAERMFEKAEACYLKAIELQPSWSLGYLRLGSLYTRQGSLQKAAAVFEQAIEKIGSDNAAYSNLDSMQSLANIYRNQQDNVKAVKVLQKLVSIIPRNTSILFDLGELYEKQGNLSKAEDCYRAIHAVQGNNTDALSRLALIALMRGDYQAAIAYYAKLLKEDPDSVEGHKGIARSLLKGAQYDEAARHFEAALKLNPKEADFLDDLAQAYVKAGRIDRAIESMQALVKVSPTAENYSALARLYEKEQDYGKAAENYIRALTDRSPAGVYADIAVLYEKQGDLGQAAAYYKKALQKNSLDTRWLVALGNLARDSGDLESAAGYFEEAIRINPKDFRLHEYRGDVARELRRLDDAVESYTRAAALMKNPVDLEMKIADALLDSDRVQEAADRYYRILPLAPDRVYRKLGTALFRLDQFKEAVEFLEKGINARGAQEISLYHSYFMLGNSYERLNNYPAAIASFIKGTEIMPADVEAWYHLGGLYAATGQFKKLSGVVNKIRSLGRADLADKFDLKGLE